MRRSRATTILAAAALGLATACASAQAPHVGGPPTRADLTYAMADTGHGWFAYASDGTTRADSARRFAAAAMWDLEGGDGARGFRLLQAAARLGVADPVFYRNAADVLPFRGCPSEAVVLAERARRRWPEQPSTDSSLIRARRARERASPADREGRNCPLRITDGGDGRAEDA